MEPKSSKGDIVIAQIPGNDAACRRLQKYADGIMLLSNNIHYAPLVFSKKDMEEQQIKILGRVIELRARF